jgi:hypothetical protein
MELKIKTIVGVIFPAVILALTACSGGGTSSGVLTVVTASTSVAQAQSEETQVVSYSATLQNKSGVSLYVELVEPQPSPALVPKLISDYLTRAVNQRLAPGQTVTVSGTFIFRATGMTKADIDKLAPFIKGYRVVYDENISVP